ncbi:uncharacterized protein LOC132612993 [Lycium barbarum]|uniref:uncharacterized protein LOC132612993 n=1 Tax=Lycium barbarum TaxID=112863 RepID=UPI00293E1561|nr:uncharacterized protein LOC132612993 [Lycium barbarum]
MGISIVSICKCCAQPRQETMNHMFVTGQYAADIWKMFSAAVGVQGPFIQVNKTINKWWDTKCSSKLKPLYQADPAIILWQLWKRRNTVFHGGNMSSHRVIYDINLNLIQLAKTRYPWMTNFPNSWPQLVQHLEQYRPHIQYILVQWISPPAGWYKCNSDGASRGNPGPSASACFVRNHKREFIHATGSRISDTTCLCAEAKAMHDGIIFCITQQYLPLILETDSLGTLNFELFTDLPTTTKRLVNMDKMHLPSLRFKTVIPREPD